MRDTVLLALRYMLYYRFRSVILVVCVSIALFLPVAVHVLVGYYDRIMTHRAEATPLVIGARGSSYDLVLNTLFFKGRLQRHLTWGDADEIQRSGLGTPVPVHVRYTARGYPIVGTTLEYFEFRKLKVKQGAMLQLHGEVVLGATVARRLGLAAGDKLPSDREKVYDMSADTPLLLRIAGVLEETGTADDMAVFTNIDTAWILDGIVHGHLGVEETYDADPTVFRGFSGGLAEISGKEKIYDEVTPETLDDFHPHGDRSEFPVTSIIIWPHDAASRTILKGRYQVEDSPQAEVPAEVVRGMMDIVFRVKSFFNAVFVMVLVSTTLFLALVVLLSLRIRQRELQTLKKIGCSRSTVFALQAAEIVILLAVSVAVAGALLGGLMWYVVRFNVLL